MTDLNRRNLLATAAFGTTYYYVVTATNSAGESANSNVANTALPTRDASIWAGGTSRNG